jgi:NADPH:quinone reductase-like Zn-dependent oxidoreductase
MKAIVQDTYGPPQDVLELRDVGEPVAGDDDVLVRVRAASVNAADWHLIRGDPYISRVQFGLRAPSYPVAGCDVAGQVEAVGTNVTTFQTGDEVFGISFMRGFGGFAEHAPIPAELLARKPANLTFERAAAVPLAGLTALQGLRDHGQIERGQRVLIVGASGGVGTFAVQIARSMGAEVTGVCRTANVDMVRELGADHVIDRTREDFTDGGQRYDVVMQVGGTRSASDCRRALTPKGTLVSISGDSSGRVIGPVGRMIKTRALSPFVGQNLVSFIVSPNAHDLLALKQLIEAGDVTPVVDRTYPLSEVPDAIRYVEEGHSHGKVVITV